MFSTRITPTDRFYSVPLKKKDLSPLAILDAGGPDTGFVIDVIVRRK